MLLLACSSKHGQTYATVANEAGICAIKPNIIVCSKENKTQQSNQKHNKTVTKNNQ